MSNPTKSVHGCPVDSYSVYSADGELRLNPPIDARGAATGPTIRVKSDVWVHREMTQEQIREVSRAINAAVPGYVISCSRDSLRDPTMLYVEIARQPEISNSETYTVKRGGKGLIPDGVHFSSPTAREDYEIVIPCQVQTRYQGTLVGDEITSNIEHGKCRVTLPDGRVFAGDYSWNGDARCSDVISNLTPVEVAQPV